MRFVVHSLKLLRGELVIHIPVPSYWKGWNMLVLGIIGFGISYQVSCGKIVFTNVVSVHYVDRNITVCRLKPIKLHQIRVRDFEQRLRLRWVKHCIAVAVLDLEGTRFTIGVLHS